MPREARPGERSRLAIVDHTETYGRHLLARVSRSLDISVCVDLGCGDGDDLSVVKACHPESRLIGVDFGAWSAERLLQEGIEHIALDIEREALPLQDETVDLIVANQILEHTKEVYWVNHEIFRVLKVGGYLYLGVPNVLSLHNRVLGLLGVHPTCAKLISAHVRVFSKGDTLLFYREIAEGFAEVKGFYGSQFYPFPRAIARPVASLLPSLATSIFFLIKKTSEYRGQFIEWPSQAQLQTNFYLGPDV